MLLPKKLDEAHLAAVRTVLLALPSDMSAARAALACEDAFVACALGVQLGLTFEAIQRNAVELLTEGTLPSEGPPK